MIRAIRIVYVLGIIAALALCLAWQTKAVREAGYELEELKIAEEQMAGRIQTYEAQVEKLKSPQRISQLVNKLGLEVNPPSEATVDFAQPDTPSVPSTSRTAETEEQNERQ
ncbi:MAG: hypothetical protein ACLFWL_15005 [Candidatus Brocadiia bacterium]